VCERLAHERLSGRTVTVKIRLYDFATHTRSATLRGPTDDVRVVTRMARRLLGEVDASAGVRLLGVGVSSLADWVQEDLFESHETGSATAAPEETASTEERPDASDVEVSPDAPLERRWWPGADVVHPRYGRGWVWGAGLGRVTVRFETAASGPGPVRTLPSDDPDLAPCTPLGWDEQAPDG
jgi:DNA polymerase-4